MTQSQRFFGLGVPALLALILTLPSVQAAGPGVELQEANIDLRNPMSLQRGAKYFVNYCAACHSTEFMRYTHLVDDLGLTPEQVQENLIFTGAKLGDPMKVAMTDDYGAAAFGVVPPDLSLTGRSRGTDWIYTFLKSFYLDPARPLGVNNKVFANVGMPHVLWDLQGWQKPVYEEHAGEAGDGEKEFVGFELVAAGSLSPSEYDQVVRDISAFLTYMGEPVRLERQELGIWVLLYLAVFTVVAYLLKKEYWKDIH